MDAATFLSYLHKALDTDWKIVHNPPKKPGDYSDYIFAALAKAADDADMEYRGRHHKRELLYDGVWLPRNGGSYRLPQVVIEHENSTSADGFIYDMRKLMMAYVPLREQPCLRFGES